MDKETTALMEKVQSLPPELVTEIKRHFIEADVRPLPRTREEYTKARSLRKWVANSDQVPASRFNDMFFQQTITVTVTATKFRGRWEVDGSDFFEEKALLRKIKNMRLVLQTDGTCGCGGCAWYVTLGDVSTYFVDEFEQLDSLELVVVGASREEDLACPIALCTLYLFLDMDLYKQTFKNMKRVSVIFKDSEEGQEGPDIHLESRIKWGWSYNPDVDTDGRMVRNQDEYIDNRVTEFKEIQLVLRNNRNRGVWVKGPHAGGDTPAKEYNTSPPLMLHGLILRKHD